MVGLQVRSCLQAFCCKQLVGSLWAKQAYKGYALHACRLANATQALREHYASATGSSMGKLTSQCQLAHRQETKALTRWQKF